MSKYFKNEYVHKEIYIFLRIIYFVLAYSMFPAFCFRQRICNAFLGAVSVYIEAIVSY